MIHEPAAPPPERRTVRSGHADEMSAGTGPLWSASVASLTRLQGTAGNSAVQRMITLQRWVHHDPPLTWVSEESNQWWHPMPYRIHDAAHAWWRQLERAVRKRFRLNCDSGSWTK